MRGVGLGLHNLSKHFGRVVALRELTLGIRAGELVSFLGPSGCGKTTTLLLIAGIYRPTTGEIHFDDRRMDALHPRDRDVGMVFQSYALYPHLTLYENVAFPLRLKRMGREDLDRRVRQVAEMLGIGQILERHPGQVSGGQQQRAALARALVKEPKVLLLDEPLSNLDAQIRLQARAEIRRLQQGLGVTSVMVTHDQAEALAMSDRVAVFSMGEVQQFAPPEELYYRPANTFVAEFVGYPSMNLIGGEFVDGRFHGDGVEIVAPGCGYAGKGWLGIRPEHVRIGDEVPGRALVVESQGREALLTVEVSASLMFKALLPVEAAPRAGEQVGLGWEDHRLHFFDRSGVRLPGYGGGRS